MFVSFMRDTRGVGAPLSTTESAEYLTTTRTRLATLALSGAVTVGAAIYIHSVSNSPLPGTAWIALVVNVAVGVSVADMWWFVLFRFCIRCSTDGESFHWQTLASRGTAELRNVTPVHERQRPDDGKLLHRTIGGNTKRFVVLRVGRRRGIYLTAGWVNPRQRRYFRTFMSALASDPDREFASSASPGSGPR
jgi:hypothetical protein